MKDDSRGRIEVWHADPGTLAPGGGSSACVSLLDRAERERLGRFRREADRVGYAALHALLRAVLSLGVPVDPRDWSFRSGPRGKPVVDGPSEYRDLSFSLSRTPGRVAIAVTAGGPVGVDVEHVERAGALEEIRSRYLSPDEEAALATVGGTARAERLLACWTLKEAFVKALGTGLDEHLADLTFHLDGSPGIRLTSTQGTEVDPGGWDFLRAAPGPAHALALAFPRRAGVEVAIREASGLPLPVRGAAPSPT